MEKYSGRAFFPARHRPNSEFFAHFESKKQTNCFLRRRGGAIGSKYNRIPFTRELSRTPARNMATLATRLLAGYVSARGFSQAEAGYAQRFQKIQVKGILPISVFGRRETRRCAIPFLITYSRVVLSIMAAPGHRSRPLLWYLDRDVTIL